MPKHCRDKVLKLDDYEDIRKFVVTTRRSYANKNRHLLKPAGGLQAIQNA